MACGSEKLFAKSFPVGDVLEHSEVSSLPMCLGFLQKESRMHGKGYTLRSLLDVMLGDMPGQHLDWKLMEFKVPEV